MVSYIRHALTEYNSLLEEGYEQESARHFVANDMRTVLKEWGVAPATPASDGLLRLSGTMKRIYSRMAEWRLVSRMNRYTTSDTGMQPVK